MKLLLKIILTYRIKEYSGVRYEQQRPRIVAFVIGWSVVEELLLEIYSRFLIINYSFTTLDISVLTVRKHIANIYEKLHVQSRAEVINMAHHNKWFNS